MTIDSDHFSMPRAIPAIHTAGWPFVMVFAGVSVGLGFLFEPFFYIGLIVTLWCAAFFRDPERVSPKGEGLIVSPADGVILPLVESPPPQPVPDDYGPLRRISVFMNVFDVHVNRIPCDGQIEELLYRPGAYLNASFDKASQDNERMVVRMTARNGRTVIFAQIAGLIARRILCHLNNRQNVRVGERFGMIRFGSRVDIYVPADAEIRVQPGQRAVAGETVLAVMEPHHRPRGARPGNKIRSESKTRTGNTARSESKTRTGRGKEGRVSSSRGRGPGNKRKSRPKSSE